MNGRRGQHASAAQTEPGLQAGWYFIFKVARAVGRH
jgi:hypothetical protein